MESHPARLSGPVRSRTGRRCRSPVQHAVLRHSGPSMTSGHSGLSRLSRGSALHTRLNVCRWLSGHSKTLRPRTCVPGAARLSPDRCRFSGCFSTKRLAHRNDDGRTRHAADCRGRAHRRSAQSWASPRSGTSGRTPLGARCGPRGASYGNHRSPAVSAVLQSAPRRAVPALKVMLDCTPLRECRRIGESGIWRR
jgi:hypothetical protein